MKIVSKIELPTVDLKAPMLHDASPGSLLWLQIPVREKRDY